MKEEQLWDFVSMLADDMEADSLRSVSQYQVRFPTIAEEIPAEYERVVQGLKCDPAHSESNFLPGQLESELGHFHLLDALGFGGQGQVFRAWDRRTERIVALKVLPVGRSSLDRTRTERFQRESRILARLSHPSICQLFDAGEVDGVQYFAMECVRGTSLAELLADPTASHALPLKPSNRKELQRVLDFFIECARALHSAHRAGIVHRDVKPGNIMVEEQGRPVLLDFGLARDDSSKGQDITREGTLMGTPAYMAPEQLQGASAKPSVDLYALAATLYECLAQVPVHPEQDSGIGRLNPKLEPPVPVRRHNPALPRDIEVVLQHALDPNPALRYSDLAAFAEDLSAARDLRPIQARPLPLSLEAMRWAQRRPTATAVAISLLLFLVLTLVHTRRVLSLERQKNRAAEHSSLITAAHLLLDSDPGKAVQLARVALERQTDAPSRGAYLSTLVSLSHYSLADEITTHGHPPAVDYSESQSQIAFLNAETQIELWKQAGPIKGEESTFQLPPGNWLGVTEGELGGRLRMDRNRDLIAIAPTQGAPAIVRPGLSSITLPNLDSNLRCLEFHPRESWLVGGCADGRVQLFNWQEPERSFETQAHLGYLGIVRFLDEGRILLTGSPGGHREETHSDHSVKLWSFTAGELRPIATIPLEGYLSNLLVDDPTGSFLVADSEGLIQAWNVHALGTPLWTRRAPNRVHALALSADKKTLAVGYGFDTENESKRSYGAVLFAIDDESKKPVKLNTGYRTVSGIAFLPETDLLATINWDGVLRILDPKGQKVWTYTAQLSAPKHMTWDRNNGCLAVINRSGIPAFVYVPSSICPVAACKPALPQLALHGHEQTRAIWFTADGASVVLGEYGTVRSLGQGDDSRLKSHRLPAQAIHSAATSTVGTHLVIDQDGKLWLYNEFEERARVLDIPRTWARALCAPNGKSALLLDEDNWLHYLDLETESLLSQVECPGGIRQWTYSACNRYAAVSTEDCYLHIFDVNSKAHSSFNITDSPIGNIVPKWHAIARDLSFHPLTHDLCMVVGPSVLAFITAPPKKTGQLRLDSIRKLVEGRAESDHVAYTKDGQHLLVANRSKRKLYLLDNQGNELDAIEFRGRSTSTVMNVTRDNLVLLGTGEGSVYVVAIEQGRLSTVVHFTPHQAPVVALEYSPKEATVLSRSEDGCVYLWPVYPEQTPSKVMFLANEQSKRRAILDHQRDQQ